MSPFTEHCVPQCPGVCRVVSSFNPCELYIKVEWPSLDTPRFTNWIMLVHKDLLGMVPPHLCSLLHRSNSHYALRSSDIFLRNVPQGRTEKSVPSVMPFPPTAIFYRQNCSCQTSSHFKFSVLSKTPDAPLMLVFN